MLPAHFYPTQAAMNRQIIAYSKPEYNQENRSHSHPAKNRQKFSDQRTVRSHLDPSPYLQIQSVPIAERINPREPHYTLMISPQGVRACAGQFSAQEAHTIAKLTRGWNWVFDENGRLRCLPALEALLDDICNRSTAKELTTDKICQSSLSISAGGKLQ